MSGFAAAQKKAQLERRRSMKTAARKQRESSYFPKVEEEEERQDDEAVKTPEQVGAKDDDYESVFKSRPKIQNSPKVSPKRIWEDEEDEEF